MFLSPFHLCLCACAETPSIAALVKSRPTQPQKRTVTPRGQARNKETAALKTSAHTRAGAPCSGPRASASSCTALIPSSVSQARRHTATLPSASAAASRSDAPLKNLRSAAGVVSWV